VIVAVVVATVLLSAAGILSIVHVARSTSVPDRAVGLDLVTSVIVNLLAVLTAWSYLPAVAVLILLLTLLAFLGSVAVARFVDRTRS
jgi:multicomponent Na+:H+ antiporter subunit F